MSHPLDTPEVTGPLLRRARKNNQMTLSEAAGHVGLSATHLSRLEKGQRQPSIGVLMQLARLYRIGVGELLGETRDARYYLTRAAGRVRRPGPDGDFAMVSGLSDRTALQAVVLTVGEHSQHRASTHDDEELLVVVSGSVALTLGGETIDLGTGDAVHFDARVEHSLRELSVQPEVLIVCTPLQTSIRNVHASAPAD